MQSYNQGFTEATLRLVGRVEIRKGLAPLPEVVAETLGWVAQLQRFPLSSMEFPHQASQPRALKLGIGAHIISGCENQWGFCLPGRDRKSARDTGTLLKGQSTKSHLQPLIMGSSGGRQSRQESCEERPGFVALGRDLGAQPLRPLP